MVGVAGQSLVSGIAARGLGDQRGGHRNVRLGPADDLALRDGCFDAHEARFIGCAKRRDLTVDRLKGSFAFEDPPGVRQVLLHGTPGTVARDGAQWPRAADFDDARDGSDHHRKERPRVLEELPLRFGGFGVGHCLDRDRLFFGRRRFAGRRAREGSRPALAFATMQVEPVVLLGRQRQERLFERALHRTQHIAARPLLFSPLLVLDDLPKPRLERRKLDDQTRERGIVDHTESRPWGQVEIGSVNDPLHVAARPRCARECLELGEILEHART